MKYNVTPERGNMALKKFPEDSRSRRMWLIKYDERTRTSTFASGYLLLWPSRHVRAYYSMPKPGPGFLCSDLLHHETFRPLFGRPALVPLVLGYSRALVGVDTGSSEVIQKTPHSLFFLPLHAARKTPRTLAASCLPCAPQIRPRGSASCAKSPRCSHFISL